MPKSKRPTQAKPAAADKRAKPVFTDMSTGEATAATLLAHGLDTVYALPGVHNDHLFDAFQRAGERLSVVHTRHEQGAAYMALGAALATGKPQTYAVVPGPGLLNSAAALLTAYGMNAPVLALIGQIPAAAIGRGFGHLHEIRDQAGIVARLVDHSTRIDGPAEAPAKVAKAIASMSSNGRPGPAALECAMDVWGKRGPVTLAPPAPARAPRIDEDAVRAAAKLLGKAKRVLIVAGGGAQDASPEVTLLSDMLQAPVLAYRRGRGVLDGRNPFSVTLPLGRELWGEADAVLGVGTRLLNPMTQWGVDSRFANRARRCRPRRAGAAAQAESGADRRCRADPAAADRRACENQCAPPLAPRRDARASGQVARPPRQDRRRSSPSSTSSAPNCRRTASMSTRSRRSASPPASPSRSIKPRTFLSPGYQDNLGWGYATALGAQHARPDVPVLSINGDGGFLYTGNELATAMRHRIPLVAVVFTDGAFGNVRRIQQEQFGNRRDRLRPRQSGFRQIRRKLRRRRPARAQPGGTGRGAQGRLCRPRADSDRGAGRAACPRLGNSSTCRACAEFKTVAMTVPDRVRLPGNHGFDHHHRGTGRGLRAHGAASLRHRRYRVPARDHLLPPALRGAVGLARRGGGGRRAGPRHRSWTAVRADDRRERGQGVPRRAPGHRNRLEHGEEDPASDLRQPGRRHGARLRRFDLLRPAGAAHHRRPARQVAPLHRLDAAAALRRAGFLRALRRHAFARRLPQARRRSGQARAHQLGRGGDGRAHLARNLSHGPGPGLGAAQEPRAQAEGARAC